MIGSGISPASPADFLQSIVDAVIDRAEALRSAAGGDEDARSTAPTEDLVDAVENEGRLVNNALEGADFGTFDALSSVLGHFNGAHLYAARTIRADHGDELPAEAINVLDELIELLGHLAVARQTFKTLYMQHELAYLSKLLLYVGFPTLLGGGVFTMTYNRIIESVTAPGALVLVVGAAVTLVFLPFVVLLVYTLRIATITSRTADFGPFVPRVELDE